MKRVFTILFGLALLAGTTQAQSKMTDAQKEEARARYEAYQEKLNLAPDQEERVEEINLTYFEGLSEVRNSGASRLSKYKKFKSISSQRDDDMKAVLTKEQYKVYQEFQKEMREDFKQKRRNG